MAVRATFTGFDPYKLTGVTVTDRELGHGSYAAVLQLDYMGLKCAGKKIHELLLRQGDTSYTVRRYEEECRLLSQVRHPNIVQFLGVHFQEGVSVPILVMEFLPTNLTSCIEQYGIFPNEISYSILHDVALGLCYLHRQTPSIIHRDLSSNNVLLTANMTAKISDLGVARILNLSPLQVSHMTQTPGTPAFMPPEVMTANPKYDTSVDQFSYGIMMIHVFSGRWPEPQVGPIRTEHGKLIPVSEAERREEFLQAIGNSHPLMELILKCIDNHPQSRVNASEIITRVSEMVLQFPASFANRLEILRSIKHHKEIMQILKMQSERDTEIKGEKIVDKEDQLQQMIKEIRRNESEIDRLKMDHSFQTEYLQFQVKDLKSQNQQLEAESQAEVKELSSKAAIYEAQIHNNTITLQREREQYEMQLSKEREMNRKLRSEISTLSNIIHVKDLSMTRKDEEIGAKARAIEEKDTTISEMKEQFSRMKIYLSSKQQVSS